MVKKIIFIMFFLCSCTVGPDYQKKEIYENQKIAQNLELRGQKTQISKDWYLMFQDEVLNHLISKGLQNSPSILAGIEKLRQARLVFKKGQAQYMPMFNLKGGYSDEKVSKNIGLAADSEYFSAGFDAVWEIDIWGKGRRLNEQNLANLSKSYYTLANMKAILSSEIAKTYFLMKTAQEKKRIAQNNLKLQNDIFQSIEDKFKAGLTDETSYHQSLYLLEKTKSLIPQIDAQILAYQHSLEVLTGTLPQNRADAALFSSAFKPKIQFETKQLFDLPVDIIRSRPDVRASEQALIAQNAAVGQAVGALYPDVSISVLVGFAAQNGTDLFHHRSNTSTVSPSVIAPIFHFGQLQNQLEIEKSKYKEEYENYKNTILNAVMELSNAIVEVKQEYQANKHKKNSVFQMKKALSGQKQKYENGLIEYSTLLESQQDLLSSELDLTESLGNIYVAIIAFYKATGGGYNQR